MSTGRGGYPAVPFEHIEAFIEYSDFDEEEKALLWLYAWCGGHAREMKEIVMAGEPTG